MDEFIKLILFQINSQSFFQVIGLIFNLAGTIILAVPLFKVWHILEEDDYIVDGKVIKDAKGDEKHSYTFPWLLKNRKFGLWGFGLLGLGFLMQLLLIIIR